MSIKRDKQLKPVQHLAGAFCPWPHTGAILCGGRSKRMGRPKAGILLPSGMTIIEHVYNALAAVCQRVVLVGHGERVPSSLYHLHRIEDRWADKGPIGGLEALLSSGIDSEYLISPCDLFMATPEIFFLLINSETKLPAILTNKGRAEPLLGRYPSFLLSLVRKHIVQGKLSMSVLLKEVSATPIAIPVKYPFSLSNINSPEDLADIETSKIESSLH